MYPPLFLPHSLSSGRMRDHIQLSVVCVSLFSILSCCASSPPQRFHFYFSFLFCSTGRFRSQSSLQFAAPLSPLVFFFSFSPPSTADPFDSADVAGSASDARRRYQNTKKKPVMCMSHVAAAFSIPRFSAWCILRARLCVECMRKKEKYKT